ncbi:hypothetical protein EDB81DRAFT_702350 [Dactylonectria macrodidyma]|uniref:NmrA-like domain-containing protein n=1 Tax=Dactylonectria macrodidyma TaxID=307937 RepID=A0A9P9IBI6_9HYPO|nr:hypothetical protein EDB81DRAFT_702350 [Dactylonectria macrodidyma]
MSSSKLITVYGATGSQGGSVVASLLQNKAKTFTLRGVTRNPDSEKAKGLKAQGVEIFQADGLVRDQVVEAFRGSWGVFINTNSDAPEVNQPDGPSETDLGKILVDAAAEAGVRHLVYSGMASASKITDGAVPNKSFEEKYDIGEYAKNKDVFETAIIVSPGWYMENHLSEEVAPLFGGFPFTADKEGYLTLRIPRWGGNEEMPFISISDDYGDLVHGVFLAPETYNRRLVQAISSSATAGRLTADFQEVTGKKARFMPVEWMQMETFGVGAFETVKNMFGFCQYSGGLYYGVVNDVVTAGELKAKAAEAKGESGDGANLMSLKGFLRKHVTA